MERRFTPEGPCPEAAPSNPRNVVDSAKQLLCAEKDDTLGERVATFLDGLTADERALLSPTQIRRLEQMAHMAGLPIIEGRVKARFPMPTPYMPQEDRGIRPPQERVNNTPWSGHSPGFRPNPVWTSFRAPVNVTAAMGTRSGKRGR